MRELEREIGLLGDDEIIAGVKRCVAQDRALTAELLVHFGELDARGLYRDLGYDSMFTYSVSALHMSESEASLRIRAARLGREFPLALEMLARGELHLTALRLLGPVLTANNLELLEAARFKSKREILELLAVHFPRPDVPSVIRRLPSPTTRNATAETKSSSDSATGGMRDVTSTQAALADVAAKPLLDPAMCPDFCKPPRSADCSLNASVIRECGDIPSVAPTPFGIGAVGSVRRQPSAANAEMPLSAGRYKIQFTASQALRDKVRHAQDLLRHQLPTGDLAQLVERAIDLLIAQREKELFARSSTNRIATPSRAERIESRHIPHAVRRDVSARDGQQCSFVAPDGKRCSARGRLEFHHKEPYARGGQATSTNIQLLCHAHNQLMAERDFGRDFIRVRSKQQLTTKPRAPVAPAGPEQPAAIEIGRGRRNPWSQLPLPGHQLQQETADDCQPQNQHHRNAVHV